MRSLLFDFGATLDYPRHWLDRLLAHYRAAGIDLTREQLDLGFDHATRVAYRSTRLVRNYGLAELVDYLVRQQISFMSREGPEELREILSAAAAGMRLDEIAGWITQSFVAESHRGFAISREVLAALSGRFRMGVVSNFYGNLDRILDEAGLARFFGAVADSSQLGIFKPEAGIFVAALKQLGAASAEAAMVGDSLGKDCAPARKLGITAIWLRNPEDCGLKIADGAKTGVEADFTIEALAELEHLRWWQD